MFLTCVSRADRIAPNYRHAPFSLPEGQPAVTRLWRRFFFGPSDPVHALDARHLGSTANLAFPSLNRKCLPFVNAATYPIIESSTLASARDQSHLNRYSGSSSGKTAVRTKKAVRDCLRMLAG
jgi:hypothetical protein